MTWSYWMRTLKDDKELCKPRDFTILLYLVRRVFATKMLKCANQRKLVHEVRSANPSPQKSKFNRIIYKASYNNCYQSLGSGFSV